MEQTAELAAQFPANIVLGKPAVVHGAEIHRLVSRCPPLDLNSIYAYLLLCEHYADTCVRAESGGETVGFVSAYRPPTQPDVLFVWQVAVAPAVRGRRLAARMLRELLRRDAVRGCRHLETTVSPSNAPSRRLFHALARDLRAPVTERVMFGKQHFGSEDHEQETLIRIGPIPGLQPSGGTQR